jgi:hypothetical protein
MSDETQEQEYNPTATVRFSAAAGFEFNDLDGMYRAAQCYLQSGFAPPSFRTPQQLIICWARGAELGLKPLQAIEGLTVINNRIGMMGDLALAMVRQSGELLKYEKEWSGEGDELTCRVVLQRKGSKEHVYSFSVAEAKKAQIYERSPTWKGYPKRMTYYRALGFGLRDEFSDILRNMYTSEELQDLATLEAVEAEKANVRFVDAETGQERQQYRPEPQDTTSEAAGKTPLEAQLAREHPEAAKEAAKKQETLMGPSADFAQAQQRVQERAQATAPALSVVDDIDMGDNDSQAQAPEKPWWVDHEIKGVKSLLGRTVGSLSPIEMSAVETRWVPKVHDQIQKATDDQLKDLKAFEERIAHDKTAKPW